MTKEEEKEFRKLKTKNKKLENKFRQFGKILDDVNKPKEEVSFVKARFEYLEEQITNAKDKLEECDKKILEHLHTAMCSASWFERLAYMSEVVMYACDNQDDYMGKEELGYMNNLTFNLRTIFGYLRDHEQATKEVERVEKEIQLALEHSKVA